MCDVGLRGASGRQWRQGGEPLTACFPQLLAERRVKRESEAEEKRARLEAMRRETAAREARAQEQDCLLYTSPSPRDGLLSRMPSSA